uniref:Uncharacterized protein n=1 Tax=Oryza barthii TaxID=65489 RepID=A0A0D3GGC3_9ORYZ
MLTVSGGEEAVRGAISGVPAEPGEASEDAGQHPGDVAPRLASLQAARFRQDDHWPGQPGEGMDHKAGTGDGRLGQGVARWQRHRHRFSRRQGILRHGIHIHV